MSSRITPEIEAEAERIFAAKRERHKKQADLPIKRKSELCCNCKSVIIHLKARGVLRQWEKPWEIEP